MIVLLERTVLLQFYKQSNPIIIWEGLSPASPTHGCTSILNDADIIIITY